jgi:anti-sigma regulatory factor (Ser/Thr protein kinase)
MELSIPASPSRLAGLRRAVRGSLREVQDEVADEVVLALNKVATNAVLHGSSGGPPIQVVIHIHNDGSRRRSWIMPRSPRPASQPIPTPTSCGLAGGGCGCWGGWSMRYALNASARHPGDAATDSRPAGTLAR